MKVLGREEAAIFEAGTAEVDDQGDIVCHTSAAPLFHPHARFMLRHYAMIAISAIEELTYSRRRARHAKRAIVTIVAKPSGYPPAALSQPAWQQPPPIPCGLSDATAQRQGTLADRSIGRCLIDAGGKRDLDS
jgi:hypothetical protein